MGADFQVRNEELLKKLEERNEGLLKKLENQEQFEATLRGRVSELKKKLAEQNIERELIKKDSEKEKLEAVLKELQKKPQERNADKEKLETALPGQIQELKNTDREQDIYMATMEVRYPRKIRKLEE